MRCFRIFVNLALELDDGGLRFPSLPRKYDHPLPRPQLQRLGRVGNALTVWGTPTTTSVPVQPMVRVGGVVASVRRQEVIHTFWW